jgi:FkbM family methyltransferase
MLHLLSSLAARWISPLLKRIQDRARWWPLGLFPVRSNIVIRQLAINDHTITLRFPDNEFDRQQWELSHLFIDDPYQLALLPKNIRTILDVGGNSGLFALLARHYFPEANIHCYEPNPVLLPVIQTNTSAFNIRVFPEGVGSTASRATMNCEGPTLEGSTVPSDSGNITITALSQALERIGGSVDLLKMDCEGAEWSILEDTTSLSKVRHLAMEYHLDEKGTHSVANLIHRLKDLGFFIDSFREASNPLVGQLTATNRSFSP